MADYRNNLKKYSQIRDSIQTGDVIAFKGSDIGAKAILAGTDSNYSHVGIAVRLEGVSVKRVFIVEAIPAGVILQALSRKLVYYPGNAWWSKLNIKDKTKEKEARDSILDWSMLQLGKSYDSDLIAGIVGKIFLRMKLPRESQYEFICSELVATALKEAKLLGAKTTSLTPKEIMELDCLDKPVKLI